MGGVEGNDPGAATRLTVTVQGWVQGVGFRWATMSFARTMGLVGLAENLPNGDVEVVVEGPEPDCRKVLDWLQGSGPRTVRRPGRVDFVDARWGPARGGFRTFSCR
jgi:acylphosphatase